MGKYRYIQNSFSSGELSPTFFRTDLKEYYQGCDVLENFIVGKNGGLYKRPGTKYVATLSAITPERIIPFIFSKKESYIVILDDGTPVFQIISNAGVAATLTYAGLNASSTLIGDPKKYKYSQSGDILILTHSPDDATQSSNSYPPILIIRTALAAFTIMFFHHPSYLTGFPSIGEVATAAMVPYGNSNVDPDIRFYVASASQGTGGTVFAVDSANTPIAFFKAGHKFLDSSSLVTQVGSYFRLVEGTSELVLFGTTTVADILVTSANLDAASNQVTITSHGLVTREQFTLEVTGAGGANPTFTNVTFGTVVFVKNVNTNVITLHLTDAGAVAGTGPVDIVTVGAAGLRLVPHKLQKMDCTIVEDSGAAMTITSAATATDQWAESAWSTERGFPRLCVFHEQRLYLMGTAKEPDTVWASQVGNIFNMMQTRLAQDSSARSVDLYVRDFPLKGAVLPTDPFSFNIASKQANVINWTESTRALQIGTAGSEYIVNGFDSIISSSSINVKKQTDYGSGNIQSTSIGNSTLFVSREGKSIRSYIYNDANGSYISVDLSSISDLMVFKGYGETSTDEMKDSAFTEFYYQPLRKVIWILTNNFQLIGMTINEEQQTAAWHYHPIRSTDRVNSICVIPSTDGSYDELWMVCQRSINGTTVGYLEKMGDDFDHAVITNTSTVDDDHPYYSDCSKRVVLGSLTATVSGLIHLTGETVKVLVNGVVHADRVVNISGEITLSTSYASGTEVIVGLPYTSKFRTKDIEAGGDFGSAQGAIQRIDRVDVRMYKSQKGSYGKESGTLDDFEYEDSTLFTGIKKIFPTNSPDENTQIEIQHDDPVPFNILNLTMRGVTYD